MLVLRLGVRRILVGWCCLGQDLYDSCFCAGVVVEGCRCFGCVTRNKHSELQQVYRESLYRCEQTVRVLWRREDRGRKGDEVVHSLAAGLRLVDGMCRRYRVCEIAASLYLALLPVLPWKISRRWRLCGGTWLVASASLCALQMRGNTL